MLPPGHAAAGYLVAAGILSITSSTGVPSTTLLWLGFLFGVLPDIDMFAAFAHTRSLVIENEKRSHRTYITHTPVFWMAVSLFLFLFTHNSTISLIVLLAPLSHLFLDSLQDDIQWLGPWSKKGFTLFKRKKTLAIPRQSFLSYWIAFVQWYWRERRLTAVLELFLLTVFLLSL